MKKKKRLVIYGGSFNPPCKHHQAIAQKLSEMFDLVIVFPCGERPDKPSANIVPHKHREEMVRLAFPCTGKIGIDYQDLRENVFTRNHVSDKTYKNIFQDHEVWHFVGGDIVVGGGKGESQIHKKWYSGPFLWKHLNFVVMERPGYEMKEEDLPPNSEVFRIEGLMGSGTMVRHLFKAGKPVEKFLDPKVLDYMKKNRLYLD